MMKQNSPETDAKKGSIISGILVSLNILFGTLPLIIVVLMVGKLMTGGITPTQIWLYGAVIAGCLTLKALFYGISVWKVHAVAYKALVKIRVNMINHLKKLPVSFLQKRKTGDLANIINHDVEQVELYLAHGLPEIMSATLIPVIIFVIVLMIDWRLGLTLVSTVPVTLLLQKVLNKFWSGWMKKYAESTKKMSEDLLEYIAGIPVIKAFSHEEQRTQKVLAGMSDYISWVKKIMLSISGPMSVVSMVLEAGLVVMIITGSVLLSHKQIDIQSFVLALVLGGIFSASFAKLATLQHFRIVYRQATNNINSVMNCETVPDKKDNGNAIPGDVVMQNVDFGYTEAKKTLLDINLTFKQNTVNAIVGASGSGKSTIASLLMGFWPVNKGTIAINGKNIAEMSTSSLSKLVSIVQQEVFMFNLSVEENIRIGRQDATKNEIIEAAKKARIHNFITTLPNGYDTLVGESGAKFSGGEKQRISIARMILKNTPVIILDEATAAIDPSNEYLIQEAINNLGEHKTIIMIAHHLNTITGADQIVVLDEGRVVANGTHKRLMQSCPLYANMVDEQNNVDNWQIKKSKERIVMSEEFVQ